MMIRPNSEFLQPPKQQSDHLRFLNPILSTTNALAGGLSSAFALEQAGWLDRGNGFNIILSLIAAASSGLAVSSLVNYRDRQLSKIYFASKEKDQFKTKILISTIFSFPIGLALQNTMNLSLHNTIYSSLLAGALTVVNFAGTTIRQTAGDAERKLTSLGR